MDNLIRKVLILFSILTIAVTVSFQATAKEKVRSKRKWKSQTALARSDGSAVYLHPNFDAPVVGQLKGDKKYRISLKVYKSTGGFGSFYKIRLTKKKYGYVSDIEVVPKYKKQIRRRRGKNTKVHLENPVFEQTSDEISGKKELIFTRTLSLNLGVVNFKETVNNSTESEGINVFGIKMVGPGALFDGPPVNAEFNVSFSVPDYYDKFSTGAASGIFTISHLTIPFALPHEAKDSTFVIWGGLSAVYYKFSIPGNTTSAIDSQELRMGLAVLATYTQRFADKYVVQAEGKYYYEKESYLGYSLAFGVEY